MLLFFLIFFLDVIFRFRSSTECSMKITSFFVQVFLFISDHLLMLNQVENILMTRKLRLFVAWEAMIILPLRDLCPEADWK